ncbi:hypothetical protein H5410_025619 [Solanum commersonii]|uniref:Uncharacterized protein n=1 Tax=Solanum commersonii TaxID=4109 RepID=A0A9J5YWI7_SOLCO|nr:hypothetical protein H5410_025619 [Solanum commersonii]
MSVSKSRHQLISSPDFVNTHLILNTHHRVQFPGINGNFNFSSHCSHISSHFISFFCRSISRFPFSISFYFCFLTLQHHKSTQTLPLSRLFLLLY